MSVPSSCCCDIDWGGDVVFVEFVVMVGMSSPLCFFVAVDLFNLLKAVSILFLPLTPGFFLSFTFIVVVVVILVMVLLHHQQHLNPVLSALIILTTLQQHR